MLDILIWSTYTNVFVFCMLFSQPLFATITSSRVCEPIKVNSCKDVGWQYTIRMTSINPNRYTKMDSQQISEEHLSDYNQLIATNCSKNVKIFLCGVYFPFCSRETDLSIPPCRNLCEEVHRSCIKYFEKVSYSWPEILNCSQFPEKNTEKEMCLSGFLTDEVGTTMDTKETYKPSVEVIPSIPRKLSVKTTITTFNTKIRSGRTFCRLLYSRNSHNYLYVEKLQACALGCMADGIFSLREKQLAEKWVSALACVCVVLSITSLFIVVFNYGKTLYPERAIIFITICFNFYGLAYMIRIFYGRKAVTCRQEFGRNYMLIDGSGNISCASTFLLTYCFSIAQNIWWLMLCVTWFLSAGLRWNSSSIKAKATLFHFLSWSAPCAITIVVLVLRKIDVNELTGVCSIGNRYENLPALRTFIIGPLFTILVMGMIFLISGYLAVLRVPGTAKSGVSSHIKYKGAVTPVILYAVVHMFFSTFILGTYFYEYFNKKSWYRDSNRPVPVFIIFLLRIVTEFFIGISSSICLLTMHVPPLYKKVRLKLFNNELAMASDRSVLHPLRPNTGTNETSI